MPELNIISNAIRTMSSREIAELVDSRHDDVKRSIDRLAQAGVIVQPPTADEHFEDAMGRTRATVVYLLDKRSSLIVVAQLCPAFTARIVDRWQELEAQQVAPVAPAITLPQDYIQALESLLASKKSEQLVIEQRDAAIRTKAHIGDKKVATAMATASAKTRENTKLRERMGEAAQSASVMAVENKTKGKFAWRPLRDYCNASELHMGNSWNPGMQINVKTCPAAAWMAVYGVDLAELFGEVTA